MSGRGICSVRPARQDDATEEAGKPTWTTATFLLYAGGFTVLGGAALALQHLADAYGKPAFIGWAALVLVVLSRIAAGFKRSGNRIAAGVFAVATVVAWGVFVGAIEDWWGWLPDDEGRPFGGLHLGVVLLAAVVVVAALASIRRHRFPLLVLPACIAAWYGVTDLFSGGGNWSAWVTLAVGAVFLSVGRSLDRGPKRVYGFWLHVSAGLTVGGALLFFWHSGDGKWALIAAGGVAYVMLARSTGRSSWAVLGFVGLFLSAGHFALKWGGVDLLIYHSEPGSPHPWAPGLVYGALGFLVVFLGLLAARDR